MAERGTCQDTERDQLRKAHSPTGGGKGRDLSGHRKKPSERGALTSWRQQRERLVRIWKEADQARHTHSLETAEGGTCQNMERTRPSEAHSLSGDGRLVRAQKETDRVRRTHFLETEEGRACQDKERTRRSEAHSRPGDGRGRGLSGHGKKLTERGPLTSWRQQRKRLVRARKETN